MFEFSDIDHRAGMVAAGGRDLDPSADFVVWVWLLDLFRLLLLLNLGLRHLLALDLKILLLNFFLIGGSWLHMEFEIWNTADQKFPILISKLPDLRIYSIEISK